MTCSACGQENPERAKFCLECGAPFARRCARCDTELPAGARFCPECGAAVSTGEAPAPNRTPRDYTPRHLADKILQSKSALEGERKQVTVLFADVKGSLELASQVDPEEWHRILDRFFQILADGVHRFEGTVNQYTGDGIMALFGAPIAHEDHAQRACYAALHLRDTLRKYADELRLERGLDFSVRMGLNSGEVVVAKIGDDLRMDYTAQGHTVGLASRVEQLAAPNSAYLTEHTAKLASGFFELRDLGTSRIRGLAEALRVYELEGVGRARTRLEVARARGFSRFVGRDSDLETLEAALVRSRETGGQVLGVVAEAGVGKSRLCYEFAERCRARGLTVLEAHAVAHGRNVPFLPILQVFRAYYGITEQDDDRTAREKIAGRLLLLDEGFREVLPLLFEFFGVADPMQRAPRMDPEARQRQLFGVLRRLVREGDGAEPGVTLIEDLHWMDGGSLAFLEQWVEAIGGARSLLLVNFRPEYHAEWMGKSYYQQLPLAALGPEATRELISDWLGDDPSTQGLAEAIHARTAGNPFFTEEVVQSLIESGHLEGTRGSYRLVSEITALEVPASVQAVLAARIDRLPEREKQVLQAASVIGREFAEPILAALGQISDIDLRAALQQLESAEFIYEESLYPVAEYAFKHPLTQEVALRSQLQDRRRRTHAAVARAMQEAYAEKLDENAALLAHHWEQADEKLPAARWHRHAAEWVGVQNLGEAQEHWRKVRSLSGAIAQSRESDELGATACARLLHLGWRTGLGEEEARSLLAEGRRLAERAENPELLGGMLVAFGSVEFLRGAVRKGAEFLQEATALAEGLGDPKLAAVYAGPLIDTSVCLGDLTGALALCDRIIDVLGDDPGYRTDILGYAVYEWALARRAAWVLMMTGRVAEGFGELGRALEAARRRGETEVAGWTHCTYGRLVDWMDDPSTALRHARQGLEIADKLGSPLLIAFAYGALGVAHRGAGNAEEAVSLLTRSLAMIRDRKLVLNWEPWFVAQLSDAQRSAGQTDRAVETALEATENARRIGTPIWECQAELSLARALLHSAGAAERKRIEPALSRVRELIEATGARSLLPLLHEARAELAAAQGDSTTRERELREARRLFLEMGASGPAQRLARELEA